MRGAGDISIKIKDHIIQHCVTNDLDLHDFLERKGGVALIKLIPELAGYTVDQVNAALKLPTLKGRKPKAKQSTSDNKDNVENEENVDAAEGRKPKAKQSTSSNVHANNNKNKVRTIRKHHSNKNKSSKTKNALAIDQLSTADILSAAAFHEKVILQDLLKQGNFPENHEIFNHVKVLCSMVRSLASTSQSDLQLK